MVGFTPPDTLPVPHSATPRSPVALPEARGACFFKIILGHVIGLDMSGPSGLLTKANRVEKLIRPGQVRALANLAPGAQVIGPLAALP